MIIKECRGRKAWLTENIVLAGMLAAVLSSTPLYAADTDGDGFSPEQWDCDDNNPAVHPVAFEICRDGIDQNCDGVDLLICPEDSILPHQILTRLQAGSIPESTVQFLEINGNGRIGMEEAIHALQVISGLGGGPGRDFDGDGYTAALGDKDDTDAGVHPGAAEICGDGIDQDCTGSDQPCPENFDADGDGYTPNDGDCNDRNVAAYPGSVDIPADGIDQDCNGCDAAPPNNITHALENFTSNQGAFILWDNYFVSGGRFHFDGAGEPYVYRNIWNGGSNPSNSFTPSAFHSNYFTSYNLSIDTYWKSGSDTEIYGLFFSSWNNSVTNGNDFLIYVIDKSGYFSIYEFNGSYTYLDGGYSFLLTRNTAANKIAVEKEGDNFRFYIDNIEVKRLRIEGYGGGGAGIITSDSLDIAFDNFKVTSPLQPTCAAGEFPLMRVKEQNEFIYKLMKSVYLWHNEVPVLDYTNYTTPEALLEDLLYEERDKWSYITTKEEYDSYFEEGKYKGVGFVSGYDQNNDLRISLVFSGSPADLAGVRRGDKILQVNGKATSVIENFGMWDTVYGERELGIPVNMMLQSPEGVIKNITMAKAWVDEKTVIHHEIIEKDGAKIGYLVFNGFTEKSWDELDEVFTYFKSAGIDELILDLRYNGGGRISVANYLGSLIGGSKVVGQTFEKLVYNSNNQHLNYTYTFTSEVNSLSLNRVVFITTEATASASEAVIVGLKPFMQTVLIGETTHGKPVGSDGFEIGDKIINAIQFKGRNAAGEGEFFNGLTVNCQAPDGMTFELGDQREASLKTALNYIYSGTCPSYAVEKSPKLLFKKKTMGLKGFQAEIGAF